MLFRNAIAGTDGKGGARGELGDTFEGSYAYSDADMLRYAVDGVREAWGTRPSLKYDEVTGRLYDPVTALPSSVNENYYPIPLPEAVQVLVTYYIIFRCLSRDVTDAGNAAAAAAWKTRFDQLVVG